MITFAAVLLGLKLFDWLLVEVLEPWLWRRQLEMLLKLKDL